MQKPPLALSIDCIVCNAKAGEKCNQPTDNGRKPMPERWYHFSRELEARKENSSGETRD